MNVAFFVTSLYRGGAERVIVNLAEQFNKAGHHVVLITLYKRDNEYEVTNSIERYSLDETVKTTGSNRINVALYRLHSLHKIYKEERIDVVISFLCLGYAILSTLFKKTKCIISIRNNPQSTYNTRLKKIIARFFLPLADGCVFQTEEARNWFSHSMRRNSSVIYNPIREVFFDVQPKPNSKIIVSCGRLEKQKNYPLLIEAFRLFSERNPDYQLKIYGKGSEKERISDLILCNKLEKKITLMGNVEHIQEAYEEAGIFVMTSDYEGMPNALMEAMACGLPCISTDCPCGGPAVLLQNNCGMLFPVGDKIQLAKKMEILATNSTIRARMALKARDKAKRYTQKEIYQQWNEYVQNICERNC